MSRKFMLLFSVLAVMFAAPLALQAQSPTPEGTIITNTVTASYTDANGNTYSDATASASVTVGFAGSIDVTGTATFTPASPSTLNEAVFTIANLGNGTDSVTVSTSAAAGLTITGYKIGATAYADLTALNAALAGADSIGAITGTKAVTIVYSVDAGTGGQTMALSLTATSRRDETKTDVFSSDVEPALTEGVDVVAATAAISQLPNGTAGAYTVNFTVENTGNTSRTYDLVGSVTGAGFTLGTVNGGTSTVTVAAGATSAAIPVTYTIATNGTTSGTVVLTATADDDVLVTDNDATAVTVIRAEVTLTKEVFRADQTTAITNSSGDPVLPGETIWYKLTVKNTGTAPASGLTLTDALPAEVTYVSHETAATGWTITEDTGTITATLTGSMAVTGAGTGDIIWIEVTVK